MELITDNEIMFGIYTDDMTWFDDDEEEDEPYEDSLKTGGRAPRKEFPLTY